MAKSRKTGRRKDSVPPTHFFESELSGEEPLTVATAKRLYDLASEFYDRSPWNILADRDLILLEAPESKELCYCSIMGALGQVYSLQAYVGMEGYRLFKRIESGAPISHGDFFASMRGLSVEFVPKDELTPPDRKLLRAFDHPIKRGFACPVFRASRPGYHPWYPAEGEARDLAECLDLANAFLEQFLGDPHGGYWNGENTYPLVAWVSPTSKSEFEIAVVEAGCKPAAEAEPPELDLARIERIRKSDYPIRGVWETDHFYTGSMVGRKNERKACIHVVLVVEASSGFIVSPPELGAASDNAADLLVQSILGAIECSKMLPLEIQVKDTTYARLLRPLVSSLGITMEVRESLPALELAKKSMQQAMGEPTEMMGG